MRILVLAALLARSPSGYVDDSLCADCHPDVAETYQHVGMAQSFYKPAPSKLIEDFDAPPYFHERSNQYFEIRKRGDALVFRRYQRAADGTPINVLEQMVDWILGSGHHARTYLYRTPGGELYQLPLSWYTRTQEWRMAPGYDRRDHEGVTRRVRHECMFCHNAYADVPRDARSYWRAQTFPRELPQGVGCQRCHGPGARHSSYALTGDMEKTRAAIVNPAKLDPKARIDVCYQCHMQPAVELFGIRTFGRDIYSFRPGQSLQEYSPVLEVLDAELARGERFEINHHPYRLEQSRCFTASAGKLTCLTCHNPHLKIAEDERAAHYRAKCMSCHERAHHADRDCTTCHMPERRTQDVVHAVMTDHFIRRTPGGPELLAPLEEREPQLAKIDFYDRAHAPQGALGELYRVVAVVRATSGRDASSVRRLEMLMAEVKPSELEPYLDLASAQLAQRRYVQLETTARTILARDPEHPLALEWLGFARAAQTGRREEAIALVERAIKRALARGEPRPESEFNLGVFLATNGRTREAITHYQRALAARPNLVAAWIRLAEAQHECGDTHAALDSLRRALALDPTNARAQRALEEALKENE